MDRTTPPRLLLLTAVAVIGLNLRPFLTGIGPLAASVHETTGLGLQGMALLTLVPMLLMGGCAFAGPALQGALGARQAVIGALALLAIGSSLRLFAASGWALIGTAALCGFGAAIVQAVFPGIIKRQFPRHVTVVTGIYSSMLMGGGALGAQVAPTITHATGNWRIGLAALALPAMIALAIAARVLPRDGNSSPAKRTVAALLRKPRAWLLMTCFGLVNGGYASSVAGRAPASHGLGGTRAPWGGVRPARGAPLATAALLLPAAARNYDDRRPWLWLTLAMQAIGFVGLAGAADVAPVVWALMLGAGLGGCFALSMAVALDHLPDPAHAGALSALMQGGGFLIAAVSPWIVALLHDWTGGFAAGWMLHLGCVATVAALTSRLAPHSYARAMNAPLAERV